MKKLLLTLCFLFMFCANLFAVGSVAVTPSLVGTNDNMRVLTFACVGDSSSGGIPDTTTDSKAVTDFVKGWYLFKVVYSYGTTPPTDNSDLYLYDSTGTLDLLGGNGVDFIKHSANNSVYCSLNSTPVLQPITGNITFHVVNDVVHSATYTVTLIFVK